MKGSRDGSSSNGESSEPQTEENGCYVLYYENGNVEYTGGFKNGLRDGPGTAYDADGNELYKGMWKKDKPVAKYTKD